MNLTKIITALLVILCLVGCDKSPRKASRPNSATEFTVKSEDIKQKLFFSGQIKPLSLASVSSPFDGVIIKKLVNFGQTVKQGKLLFVLDSTQLEKEYSDVLASYLKAKDDYAIAKAKFSGTEDLWKLGLISRNSYISEESSLTNTRLNFIQKERDLREVFKKIGSIDVEELKKLDFKDIKAVEKALNRELGIININAPVDGVFLQPPKTGSDSNNKEIEVGTDIKQGEALGLIGNLTGVAVDIDVSEIDLEKIKPGLPATITGVAFPNQNLKGSIKEINSQATTTLGSAGGLPTFAGVVVVPTLTPEQSTMIKVGMSAKVSVDVVATKQMLVPIRAVSTEKDKLLVYKKEKNSFVKTPVTTGSTTANKVVIKTGLQAGDVIQVPGTDEHVAH